MKKISLMLVAFVATMSMSAQNLLPQKGDFGLEIGMKPFSQSGVFNLVDNGIKMRYFLSDADAVRLQVAFDANQSVDKLNNNKSTSGAYDIIAGYERHFGLSDRIDAYVGAQAGFLKDFAVHQTPSTTTFNSDLNGHVGVNRFMAGALTGIDVYVWKGLYCGAEMGLKWNMSQEADKKVKDGAGTSVFYTSDVKASSFGFYIDPAIRIGWMF